MNLLTRQLAAELARSFLLVAVGLLVLFDLIAFLTEAEDIGDGNYNAVNAITYVLMTSPARLIDLTPFVCLLGTLVALAQLNRTSELIAVRTAGVSVTQIALTTVILSIGYVGPLGVLDWQARPLYQDAVLARMHLTSAFGNELRGSGFWTVSHDTYVHVETFDDAQQPKDIRIFEFDDEANLKRYINARSADVQVSDDWQLQQVAEKVVTPGKRIDTRFLGELPWTPVWDPAIKMYELPNDSLSVEQLRSRIAHRQDVEQSVSTLQVELWTRMALPVTGLIFVLFATPFALKPNPRGGMAGQIAIGSVLALLIYLAQQLVINASVLTGLPPVLAVALPALAVLGLGAFLLKRTA